MVRCHRDDGLSLLVVSPWMIRNLVVFHGPAPRCSPRRAETML